MHGVGAADPGRCLRAATTADDLSPGDRIWTFPRVDGTRPGCLDFGVNFEFGLGMRLSTHIPVTLAFALGACAGAGCGGGSGANVIAGTTYGGSVHLEIDDGAGSGVEGSHVPATLITVLVQDPTSGADAIFLGGYLDEGNGVSAKQWQILFTVASAPGVGSVYTVSQATGTPPPTDAAISFEEDDNRLADWVGDSGTVSVESVVGTVATFAVSMVDMAPSSGAATGPFTFNGQMVVDLSNLCNCSD